jgi:ATP-dependent exoDNAse (exonuclease V) alpha subunit
MNAIQFIKDHGVEKSREVIEGAPRNTVYYWQIPKCKHGVYSSLEQNQGRNDTRHRANADVREFLGRESPYPMVGDKLMFLKNNKEFNVVNGMTGVCTSDYYAYSEKAGSIKVDVQLEDGREMDLPVLVPYFQFPGDKEAIFETPGWSRKKNLHADYGFVCTCHKAQGSQFVSGIVLEEPLGKTDELRRRWLYTAVTRFANSVIMAG